MKATYFVFVLAALCVLPSVFAVTNLSQNQTFTFNYVNGSNENSSEVLYCAAQNESLCAQYNMSINLTTGDSVTRVNGSCSVNAVCIAPAFYSNATCVINRTVGPGESFVNSAGPCNVSITVTGSNVTEVVPQRVNVTVTKDNEIIHINIGGKTFDIPLVGSFQYSQVLEPICPINPTFQETDDVDYLVKQCRSWVPMLDDTITTLVANTRECSESARSHVDDIKDCGKRERDLMTQVSEMTVKVESSKKELDTMINDKAATERKYADEAIRADTNKALAWMFGVFFVIAVLAIVGLLMMGRTRSGGRG